ncbi:hypothetical protein [Pleomorphovibrio marinus]|uniref:hypothetical protein n=1 Tax=Pleomorphovibrio marinus TaxID=2164132 RepID=UPI000E0B3D06|nr:hypothetical protein [Pleomorphovibrio marinus]
MKKIALIGICSICLCFSSFSQVKLVVDYDSGPVSHGVVALGKALVKKGESVKLYSHSDPLEDAGIRVILVDPAAPNKGQKEIEKEGYSIENQKGEIHVKATDEIGAMYGLLAISDELRHGKGLADIKDQAVNPAMEYRIVKFNLPWSPYRDSEATRIHTKVCRDLNFWERFLDMMVENRLNVLSLWNNHPFPYMVRTENFPDASPFDQREMEEWQDFWHSLFRMAKDRGIQTFIVNWNIVVSPSFVEAYGGEEYNDLSEQVIQYTRESVATLIDEYPDLTGIGVTLADWMGTFDEKMTPEEREGWIEETFVQGMKDAERKVKFLHRSVLAGDPMAMREVLANAELEDPALVEIKFNWSHGHSTPKLAITHDYHSGELDQRFWDPIPEDYNIQWMIRNEDFFILRWGQPDFVREHLKENNHTYVNGYFIGSEGYIPALDYSHVPSPQKTWQYAFEKQWMFYKVWGRLLYDDGLPDHYFEDEITLRYGEGTGKGLLKAYKLASNVPMRLASFYRATWDYTLYAEGFLAPEPSNHEAFFDRSSPFISLEELVNHETLDPGLMSISDFVKSKLQENGVSEKMGPLDLADLAEIEAKEILELLGDLRRMESNYSGALQSELDDMETWAYLGLYFADKVRAGVAWEFHRQAENRVKKDEAISYLERCVGHWDEVIRLTKDRYRSVPHVSTEHYGEEFTTFSWEQFRPQVVRDLEIVKKSK